MSTKVDYLAPFLVTLKSLKPRQRKVLLDCCGKSHIKAFEEVCLNIVKNTTDLSPEHFQVCQRYRKSLKLLALRKYPIKAKKQILLQKGGFLAAILPVLASVVGGVLASY